MESKTTYIEELEKSLANYYKARASGNIEEIKYHQGFSKAIVHMIRTFKLLDEDELNNIVNSSKLDFPSVYRS